MWRRGRSGTAGVWLRSGWRCSGGLSTSRANGRRIFFPSWYGGKRRTPARGICARGRKAAVEGRLQARSYQAQDGGKRYVTEVVAEQVEFLSPAQRESGGSAGAEAPADGFADYGGELPF